MHFHKRCRKICDPCAPFIYHLFSLQFKAGISIPAAYLGYIGKNKCASQHSAGRVYVDELLMKCFTASVFFKRDKL